MLGSGKDLESDLAKTGSQTYGEQPRYCQIQSSRSLLTDIFISRGMERCA